MDGVGADDATVREEAEVLVIQMETFQGVQNASASGYDAVSASRRKMARVDLEHASAVGGSVAQGGVEHGVLIHIGHQCW